MQKVFVRIYREVAKIPKGKTATYGEIALLAGTTPRVVGYALHANKDQKNIPCHRVIFKDGSLAKGYVFGGEGEQKRKLQNEGICFNEKNMVLGVFSVISKTYSRSTLRLE